VAGILEIRFSIPWAQKAQTIPLTVAFMLVTANAGDRNTAKSIAIKVFFILKSLFVHSI
jgi:hypothetical protein